MLEIIKSEHDINVAGMSSDEFDGQVEDILSSLICIENCITEEDYDRCSEEVIDLYNLNFRVEKGPPDIDSIILDVIQENWEKVLGLAAIDFYHGKGKSGYREYLCFEEGKDDDEYIQELADMWFGDYHLQSMSSVNDLVSDILRDHKMCHKNPYDIPIHTRSSNETVYMFDSQNLLLPEWHVEMMASVTSNSEYYTEKNIDDLISISIISN